MKRMTNKWLRTRYKFFNRKYFANQLPKIPVKFGPLPVTVMAGLTHFTCLINSKGCMYWEPEYIIVSDRYRKYGFTRDVEVTLLHEMIHCYLPEHECSYRYKIERTTRKWRREVRRLARLGAFDYLI